MTGETMDERDNPYAAPLEESDGLRTRPARPYMLLLTLPLYLLAGGGLIALAFVALKRFLHF